MTQKPKSIEKGIKRYKAKDGKETYHVRIKDHRGRWFEQGRFDRLVDARTYKAKLVTLRSQCSDKGDGVNRRKRVSEFWDQWASQCRGSISEGWKLDQDRYWQRFAAEDLGSLRLIDVQTSDIQRILVNAQAAGLGPQSVLHIYNVLHKVFEDAVEIFDYLDHNPVRKRLKPTLSKKLRQFLTPEQLGCLLEASRHHPYGTAVWLSSFSGLRIGEIQALRWNAVKFDPPKIEIRATYQRKVKRIECFPKNREQKAVDMPAPLVDFLAPRSQGKPLDSWVAPNSKGLMLDHDNFGRYLARECERLGLPVISAHELRHSCTELWVRHGATREDISRLLNQKSQSVVDRYMHRTDDRTAAIAKTISLPSFPTSSAINSAPLLRLIRN